MNKPDLTVIILTYNERIHIRRVIESVMPVAVEVWIVDSYSEDDTLSIAESMGAKTIQHTFTNQASQFQWALENCEIRTSWILRMDADEYLTHTLIEEIMARLEVLPKEITGVVLKRQVHFMGKWIRHGGYYPVKLLRIWRTGMGRFEQRLMDEHVVLLEGKSIEFENDFIDENLNSLTWWTAKHNDYATREAIAILDYKFNFLPREEEIESKNYSEQTRVKRWYKNNIYLKLPLFIRCFLYFLFRFWIKLGFLDGRKGLIWHFLQGFWYRFLVDAKIYQIQMIAGKKNKSIHQVLVEDYGFEINSEDNVK